MLSHSAITALLIINWENICLAIWDGSGPMSAFGVGWHYIMLQHEASTFSLPSYPFLNAQDRFQLS